MSGISRTQAFADVAVVFTLMPQAFRDAMLEELRAFAPQLEAHMQAGVPTRSGPRPAAFRSGGGQQRPAGGLVSLLSTRIDVDDLRLSGGLLTPTARGEGFYGYILDAGRGMKKTRSRPRSRLIAGGAPGRFTARYTRAISPIPPDRYDITFGRVRNWAREAVDPVLTRVYDQALIRVAWNTAVSA